MRNFMMAATFAFAVAGFQGEANAQFCPGAGGTVFIDVPIADPFCPSITWIAERGVTLGCVDLGGGQALYCPADNVNRTQMAAFLNRLGNALFPLNCSTGQVMAWDGTMWACTTAAGPAGPAGPTGPTGATGPAGPQGPQGDVGPAGAVGAAGPQGPQGDVGPMGPVGATGATGATGAAGAAGTDGKTVLNGAVPPAPGDGVDGDFFIDTVAMQIYGPKAAGAWGSGTSLVGPTGPAGAQGAQGATGATGPAGPAGPVGPIGATGPQGPTGAQGATGATGAAGPTGATGPQGPQGAPGSAITATPYTTVSANYTAAAGDYMIFCNVTGANRTITLPSAASNGGRVYVVRRVGTGSNDCTVTPVQGGTRVLNDGFLQPRAVTVQSDGTTWWIASEAYQ